MRLLNGATSVIRTGGPTHYESVQTLTDEVRAWGYVREVVSSRHI